MTPKSQSGARAAEDRESRLTWARSMGAELSRLQASASTLGSARAATTDYVRRWPAVAGVAQDSFVVGDVPVHRYRPSGVDDLDRLLYVHGGGFTTGSGADYRALLGRLATDAGMEVLACDYRLAPEHPFPAALDDVDQVLDSIMAETGSSAIGLAADSAGGALAVAAVLRRLRRRAPLPWALVLFSPLLDLAADAPSYEMNEPRDPLLSRKAVQRIARAYAGGSRILDPELSPLRAVHFRAFPPTSLYVSSHEVLRDDAVRLAHRLASDGSAVRLQVEPGTPHVWPVFGDALPEAQATIRDAATFLRATRAWAS
jgi:monoterpene epsilon-lactone hydrolase